jgi:hypothetical protein
MSLNAIASPAAREPGPYARNNNLRLSDLAQAFIDSDPADFPRLIQQAHP